MVTPTLGCSILAAVTLTTPETEARLSDAIDSFELDGAVRPPRPLRNTLRKALFSVQSGQTEFKSLPCSNLKFRNYS